LLANGAEILLVLFVGMLALALWRKRNAVVIKFMLMTLAILTLMILLNELIGLIPTFQDTPTRMRYFLILWVPFTLLFAYGLSVMPRWPWTAILCLLFWCVAGYQFYRSENILTYAGGMNKVPKYPPMQDYIYHLEGKVRTEDYLLGFSFLDYVNRDLKHGKSAADFYTQLHLGIDGAFIRSRASTDWVAGDLGRKIDNYPYLLLTYDPQNKPKYHLDKVINRIQADYVACDVIVDEPDLFVQRYVNPMLDCNREYAPIAYDNGIRVVDRFARYVPESEVLQILTGWEVPDESLLDEYNVSLQIITPEWQNVRQIDRHLYEREVLKWYEAELSTEGLPAGDYRAVVIVYDRETNKKVNGIDLTTGESANIFPVLTFTIEP